MIKYFTKSNNAISSERDRKHGQAAFKKFERILNLLVWPYLALIAVDIFTNVQFPKPLEDNLDTIGLLLLLAFGFLHIGDFRRNK